MTDPARWSAAPCPSAGSGVQPMQSPQDYRMKGRLIMTDPARWPTAPCASARSGVQAMQFPRDGRMERRFWHSMGAL